MTICPEDSELQPLHGRVKRAPILGPFKSCVQILAPLLPGFTKEHVWPAQHCACPSLSSVTSSLLFLVGGAEPGGVRSELAERGVAVHWVWDLGEELGWGQLGTAGDNWGNPEMGWCLGAATSRAILDAKRRQQLGLKIKPRALK